VAIGFKGGLVATCSIVRGISWLTHWCTEAFRTTTRSSRLCCRRSKAYPDVPDWRAEHIARNFSQIVSGVISVGKRLPVEETGETSHMDMVNSIVFWCVANTHLEDFLEKPDPRPDDECVIPAADAQLLMH